MGKGNVLHRLVTGLSFETTRERPLTGRNWRRSAMADNMRSKPTASENEIETFLPASLATLFFNLHLCLCGQHEKAAIDTRIESHRHGGKARNA